MPSAANLSGLLRDAARPVRLAFVGRRVEHAWSALSAPAGGLEPVWVEHRDGGPADDLADRLAAAEPDVVVVFAPERVPRGALRAIDAPLVAFQTDPLELEHGDPQDPWGDLDDLEYAVSVSGGLGRRTDFDPADYDRVMATDPLLARVAPQLGVWRSPPLPVDDALYDPPRTPSPRPRPLFLGESSAHREDHLIRPKHYHELTHYAFGLAGTDLRDALGHADVGVVLHPTVIPGSRPEAALMLAAGLLLVTEPLVPPRGLEAGLDHLAIEAPDQLMRVLGQLALRPHAFDTIRRRGRAKAEGWRASRMWPRLVSDLAADLDAFGARSIPAAA